MKQDKSPYIQGDYTILKRWYRHSLARKPNPLMGGSREGIQGLCCTILLVMPVPSTEASPTHIAPFQINDGIPTEVEVKVAVYKTKKCRT